MGSTPLAGKTIIVTGASRGIGRAIARRIAREGANVVIASKTVDDTQQKLKGTIFDVAREVEEAGGTPLPLQVDVRDAERVAWMAVRTAERFGGIDAVINNAGSVAFETSEALSVKRFDLMFAINVRAPFLCVQACLPFLKRAANAHILNLSPPLSFEDRWFRHHAPYTTSKYAMTLLAHGMAAELRDLGIAANTLWPQTLIATDAVDWMGGEELLKGTRTPEIMADAAFEVLISDAREVTGRSFIDETLLRERGYTDFDRYAAVPGNALISDLFVPAP